MSGIERVLTDNGKAYADSHVYAEAIETIEALHKRTRPYRPQTNGKAERGSLPCRAGSISTTMAGPIPHWTDRSR